MSADLARLAGGELHLPDPAPPPVALAAEELCRYLHRMFGAAPARRPQRGPAGAWLALAPPGAPLPEAALAAPADAEHERRLAGQALALAGGTPRALLAAAYALLEDAGCRWSPAGAAEEQVPAPGQARGDVRPRVLRPAFARRAYVSDLATWHYEMPARLAERLPSDRAFVDWMAKSGATGLFFIRHANDTRWSIPELEADLAQRGLAVEGGGHALAELLPRGLFTEHPEYFPLAGGARTDLGNVCVSSREALATIATRASEVARPDMPVHLWGVDFHGGGWCTCPGCATLTTSDQALTVCNAAAEALASPRVFHLAYHDTLRPPARVRPHPRVWAEFAPRERCYAHALDDPACTANAPYRAALEQHLALFDGRVEAFEYYGDAILFGGCAVPLVEVIARDLAYYERAGVRGVSCLVFGAYSLFAHGANVEAFARGALRPAAAREAPEVHCARVFHGAAASMVEYLAALERMIARAATDGDLLHPPRSGPRARTLREGLRAALGEAAAVHRLLAGAVASAPTPRLLAERRLLDYTLAALGAVHAWLDAVLAGGPGSPAAGRAVDALEEAGRHLDDVGPTLLGTWGTHDLPVTRAFFAAALRAEVDIRESFLPFG